MSHPSIAVTLGDPAGIGPEVILQALGEESLYRGCDIKVVGNRQVLQDTYQRLKMQGIREVIHPEELNVIDILRGETSITPGEGNAMTGEASFAYLEKAIDLNLRGECQGIVTGPIAKNLWKAAGYDYPGQTELLGERAGISCYGMLFVAESPHNYWQLRCLLVTTHIPLSQVTERLTPELLTVKLDLLIKSLKDDFGVSYPRISIAGLNPHSGENGQLGTEEKEWLIPWIEEQRKRNPQIQLSGPIPPDTLWVKPGQVWYGLADGGEDAYLALYHDQGLIPVKLLAFDRAVNTTIGLPFIRTSPDHGTAFDIAGQGKANPQSMKAALKLAIELISKIGKP